MTYVLTFFFIHFWEYVLFCLIACYLYLRNHVVLLKGKITIDEFNKTFMARRTVRTSELDFLVFGFNSDFFLLFHCFCWILIE